MWYTPAKDAHIKFVHHRPKLEIIVSYLSHHFRLLRLYFSMLAYNIDICHLWWFDSHQHTYNTKKQINKVDKSWSRDQSEKNWMKIKDAAEAAIESRYKQEAEDGRRQDIRFKKQTQIQECPEICSDPSTICSAQARSFQNRFQGSPCIPLSYLMISYCQNFSFKLKYLMLCRKRKRKTRRERKS